MKPHDRLPTCWGRLARWLALAVLLLCGSAARADTYEWERTEQTLRAQGLTLSDAPEGKRIAWIRVVRDDVFVRDELWPLWFNWFHATTREEVVRRELLFANGEAYRETLVEETMRNLRGMQIFSLVRIVAVQTPDPNAVGVLVHTRDLWSLRFEQAFNVTTQLNQLTLTAAERNLFGRNKTLGVNLFLVPYTYTLRQFYNARRVWGSSVSLTQSAGVIFRRGTRDAEGSLWALSVGQPFYNLRQRYAWSLDAGYENQMIRRLREGVLRTYQLEEGGDFAYRVFRRQDKTASLTGYLRLGERYKTTFGAGWDYRELDAAPNAETMLPDALRAGFARDVMPKQRREIGPLMYYEVWTPRYVTFTNLGTYGQSENVRVGPSAALSLRAPLSAFGSSSHSWVLGSTVGFVAAPGGGLTELKLNGVTRYEEQKLVDQRASVMLRGATPVFGVFRLVARATLEVRRRDTARTFVTLGSDNGLRGYGSQAFYGYGASRALGNVELRTLPITWKALHVGGVIFYDTGSVFANFQDMRWHHAAGVGIRFLFPQFSRYPFALDGGMSADPDFRFVPTFSSAQIVPLTAAEDPI